MNIEKILRAGYFDQLRVDGYTKPIYNSIGIPLFTGQSFKDSFNASPEAFKNGFAQLSLRLVGESATNIDYYELERIREDRKASGLVKLNSLPEIDRYVVAYANIIILKGDYALPFDIDAKGRTENDVLRLANKLDLVDVMLASLELQKYIINKYKYSPEWVNIAIIDKVYVEPIFRQSHISTWIHTNISDLINTYSLLFPTGLIMTYGDFSEESSKSFNMNKKEYDKMLLSHYKSLGYKNIKKLNLNGLNVSEKILYKIFI